MPEQKSCPFCQVDVLRNRMLWQNRWVFVVLSNPNLMPGHLLVIPKRHAASFSELPILLRFYLFWVAMHFQKKVIRECSRFLGMPVGCDLAQHDRSFLTANGISVPDHLHFHVRPRTLNDELYQVSQIHETPLFKRPIPEGELVQYQTLLGGW